MLTCIRNLRGACVHVGGGAQRVSQMYCSENPLLLKFKVNFSGRVAGRGTKAVAGC